MAGPLPQGPLGPKRAYSLSECQRVMPSTRALGALGRAKGPLWLRQDWGLFRPLEGPLAPLGLFARPAVPRRVQCMLVGHRVR